MLYQAKHNKFIYNGYKAIEAIKNKSFIVSEKYGISKKSYILKEDFISSSKRIYKEFEPIIKSIKNQYIRSHFSSYIALGVDSFSEIIKDIKLNPLSNIAEEQVKIINNKHFLTIGFACFLLSSVSLQYQSNLNNISNKLNINLNLSHPQSNPTDNLAQSLQPKFMTSIFHSKIDAFTKLLGMTEGKANFFYRDNLGIATAYGWNPTKNSKEFNIDVANKLGMSHSQVKSIEKISNNSQVQSVPNSLKKVVLSDKQIQKSAEIMMVFYENEFLKEMKHKAQENGKDYNKALIAYHKLPYDLQVVMVHMTYKVGGPHLRKYNDFFKKLFVYMDKPTSSNWDKFSNNFNYSFKTRTGKIIHDIKTEQIHYEFVHKCSINESDKKQTEVMNERIQSCRNLVASKTIKLTNKG